MHDPTAIFRFEEHNIYIPMVVLEELDASKKGLSEVARNARQVSRFLDELMQQVSHDQIRQGVALERTQFHVNGEHLPARHGRLFFQTDPMPMELPGSLPGHRPDNSILGTVLALQARHPDAEVVLVSKDINLRIKAACSASMSRIITTIRCSTTSIYSTPAPCSCRRTSGSITARTWSPGRSRAAPSTASPAP